MIFYRKYVFFTCMVIKRKQVFPISFYVSRSLYTFIYICLCINKLNKVTYYIFYTNANYILHILYIPHKIYFVIPSSYFVLYVYIMQYNNYYCLNYKKLAAYCYITIQIIIYNFYNLYYNLSNNDCIFF